MVVQDLTEATYLLIFLPKGTGYLPAKQILAEAENPEVTIPQEA